MPVSSSSNIPAYDFHAINVTIQARIKAYGDALRAYIVFGQLVETGLSNTIEILEVIEGWEGPRRASFASTPELPLSGRLTIYFLRPEEFERPTSDLLFGETFSSYELLNRVERAYTILTEKPMNYAWNVMERFDTVGTSPLSLVGLGKA